MVNMIGHDWIIGYTKSIFVGGPYSGSLAVVVGNDSAIINLDRRDEIISIALSGNIMKKIRVFITNFGPIDLGTDLLINYLSL
jgi:hypothetical protein